MRATILCPTYIHGRLLECAMRSVLAQTHEDFEVFLVGDGVTSETRNVVNKVLQWDTRIEFVDRPKSVRHGEEYRHEVLCERATGDAVFYISDDDIWLPEHMESMLYVLKSNDVAHSIHASVSSKGEIMGNKVDWAQSKWLDWTLEPPRKNAIGLSQVGHRMEFYRTLPHGWRTTPEGEWSDHYMWKQMLTRPGVRAAGSGRHTVIQFPSPTREGMTERERFDEVSKWLDRALQNPRLVEENIDLQIELKFLKRSIERVQQRAAVGRLRKEIHKARSKLAELRNSHAEILGQIHQEWGESMEKKRRRIAVMNQSQKELKRRHTRLKKLVKGYQDLPAWYRRLGGWLGFKP